MKAGTLRVIEYPSLLHGDLFHLGWSSEYLDPSDMDVAIRMSGYEIRMVYLDDDPARHDAAEEEMGGIFWELSERCLGGTFLVAVEHSVEPKGRRRSFTGFFPYKGRIKAGEYKEVEYDWGHESSFFMGMAPVTSENRKECFTIGKSVLSSFWIAPGGDRDAVYSADFLQSIRPFLDMRGSTIFSFHRLIPFLCRKGHIVISFGRSQQEEHVSLSVFSPQKMSMEALRSLGREASDNSPN